MNAFLPAGALGTGAGLIMAISSICELNAFVVRESGCTLTQQVMGKLDTMIMGYVDIHSNT